VSAPTETSAPPADDESEESGVESVVDDSAGSDGQESDLTAEVGLGSDDIQATADAQATAEAAGMEEATELAEAGATTQANTVGAGTNTISPSQEEESASAGDGSSSRNAVTIILVLIGGLFFTLGGIAAVWFFFINRNG
jgi:cobalamin biosynthesis Mg chelatase CobN